MNDRVKELETQCWETRQVTSNADSWQISFNSQKFAESLIREASQFVSGSAEVYTQAEQDACVRAAIGLKKYFGVE